MELRNVSPLYYIFDKSILTSRFEIWLWFYFRRKGAEPPLDLFGTREGLKCMATIIKDNPQIKAEAEALAAAMLLKDHYFNWITTEKRQHGFLLSQINKYTNTYIFPLPANLFGRNLVIATIDCWNATLDQKATHIKNLENTWINQKKQDTIFKWFKSEQEPERCAMAWDWIAKNLNHLPIMTNPIENHTDLLIFFDKTNFDVTTKKLYVDAIKKRWNQQQYREKLEGKKQYNFVLSDTTIRNLDNLAKKYDLKRPQVLEVLLSKEEELGILLEKEGEKKIYIAAEINETSADTQLPLANENTQDPARVQATD